MSALKYVPGQRVLIRDGASVYSASTRSALLGTTGPPLERDALGETASGAYQQISSLFAEKPGDEPTWRTVWIDSEDVLEVLPPKDTAGCTPEELIAAGNTGFNEALSAAQGAVGAIQPREVAA